MREKILFIEDDKNLQLSLRLYFLENNFLVEQAYTGAEGLAKIEKVCPDLVTLDLGLPDIYGEDVCRRIKEDYPDLPIIMLTAKNTSQDVIKGLGLGADDYVPKPFNLEELLARVRTRLRKSSMSLVLKVGDLTIHLKKYEVSRGGNKIDLTPTEFNLLEYLVKNQGRVVSRDSILSRVWSYDRDVQTRVVDVYVGYLRKKIDKGFKTKLIHNVRGFGYVVKPS